MSTTFDYANSAYPIRTDIAEAHREAWRRIAQPGAWWSGAERVAIVEQSRIARDCTFCAQRRAALSPHAADGAHDAGNDSVLSAATVDAVHRIVTDPTRLTEEWVRALANSGVSDAHYAEMLGIVVAAVSIDTMHRALGLALAPLPHPTAGEPSRHRPATAKIDNGWLPTITKRASSGTPESDLYEGMPLAPAVIAAMSLSPDSVRLLKLLAGVHYLSERDVGNPSANAGRALTRPQIELVAARVSAINECFF